ncbi:uncharacterized protein LOC135370606 isoform X2 [Ornithodoros turicata]|uniref:uncharacterized protein LOC135370606 isoform X2 n=1 Tax=Ornithodoros turicata TaxID=34597 RepID=UPI003138D949
MLKVTLNLTDYSLERLLGPAPKRRMIDEQCLSRLKLEVAPSADDYDEDSTAYCIPNDPPGPHARGHTDGFQSKAIELLLENRSLLYDIHQRISSFEAFGQASNGLLIPHTISPLLEQPLSSVEEFTQAEIALKDRNTLRALVDRLALIGGSDMNGAVKHIVDRCLKNSLQAQFSLDGRKGKRAFKISPLCSVIVAAVQKRLSCLGETPTEKEVLARIGKYLAGWSDRDGGRKKRAQQQES